jgi:hypothetical protein
MSRAPERSVEDGFEAGGRAAIERCRLERPTAYLRLLISLVPKQVTEKVDPF